jgi:hypothetical protein
MTGPLLVERLENPFPDYIKDTRPRRLEHLFFWRRPMLFRTATMAFCLVFLGRCLAGEAESTLPESWHGVWTGTLKIHSSGKPQDLHMELHIGPIKESNSLTWRIIYGKDKKRQVRDYELAPEPKRPGYFKIDEKNGIVIDARLMGNALYSHFKVGDALINAKYERRGDSLWVEIASVSAKDPRITGIKERKIEVQSYLSQGVQVGELKRN